MFQRNLAVSGFGDQNRIKFIGPAGLQMKLLCQLGFILAAMCFGTPRFIKFWTKVFQVPPAATAFLFVVWLAHNFELIFQVELAAVGLGQTAEIQELQHQTSELFRSSPEICGHWPPLSCFHNWVLVLVEKTIYGIILRSKNDRNAWTFPGSKQVLTSLVAKCLNAAKECRLIFHGIHISSQLPKKERPGCVLRFSLGFLSHWLVTIQGLHEKSSRGFWPPVCSKWSWPCNEIPAAPNYLPGAAGRQFPRFHDPHVPFLDVFIHRWWHHWWEPLPTWFLKQLEIRHGVFYQHEKLVSVILYSYISWTIIYVFFLPEIFSVMMFCLEVLPSRCWNPG